LFDDFVSALSGADAVIVAPIYAAREINTYGVSAELLAGALRRVGTHALSGDSFDGVARLLAHTVEDGDVIVVMGAGDIEKVYPLLPIEKPTTQDVDR
jgi:UDP-N-acetylmuramate--alanine ligase